MAAWKFPRSTCFPRNHGLQHRDLVDTETSVFSNLRALKNSALKLRHAARTAWFMVPMRVQCWRLQFPINRSAEDRPGQWKIDLPMSRSGGRRSVHDFDHGFNARIHSEVSLPTRSAPRADREEQKGPPLLRGGPKHYLRLPVNQGRVTGFANRVVIPATGATTR